MTKGHKIWEWHYDKDTNKVYRLKGMVMDVYELSLVRNYANQPNCWMRSRIDVPLVDQGKICSMKDVALAVKSITSHSPWPPSQATPSTFWEVIRGRGNTWMWYNLSITGDCFDVHKHIHPRVIVEASIIFTGSAPVQDFIVNPQELLKERSAGRQDSFLSTRMEQIK
jgi:hypothetical protein